MTRAKATTKTTTFLTKKKAKCEKLWTLPLASEPREENASYLATWLEVLRNDSRFIFKAAAHAQRAADYLRSFTRSDNVSDASDINYEADAPAAKGAGPSPLFRSERSSGPRGRGRLPPKMTLGFCFCQTAGVVTHFTPFAVRNRSIGIVIMHLIEGLASSRLVPFGWSFSSTTH